MRFLLDTDICIYAMKQHAAVVEKLGSKRRVDVGISVITEAELRFGALNSVHPAKSHRVVDEFLMPLTVVDFTSFEARGYADIRRALQKAGTPIGDLDYLIAAQARVNDLILVTNNEREFKRVPGLRVENWTS